MLIYKWTYGFDGVNSTKELCFYVKCEFLSCFPHGIHDLFFTFA